MPDPPAKYTAVEAPAPCVTCGSTFSYALEFYRERGISPPLRCRSCRMSRTQRLVGLRGQVSRIFHRAAFIEGEDGHTYRARWEPGLRLAVSVMFQTDPKEAGFVARNVKVVAE